MRPESASLFGIPNCDQVKKARAWLNVHAVPHTFHDFKKSGVNEQLIASWLHDVPWEILVNRKGTTWRGLADDRKAAILDSDRAMALMLEFPSIIKRPVLVSAGKTHVGFSADLYRQIFINTSSSMSI